MLNSLTPKGLEYIKKENDVANVICKKLNCKQIHMAHNDTQVDRLFFRDDQLVAIGEIKTRNLSLSKLKEFDSYLISYNKILTGKAFSDLTGVPYFLFVKLIEDDEIYFWKICNEKGEYTTDFIVDKTRTPKNINGGSVIRSNAYLSLKEMQKLE